MHRKHTGHCHYASWWDMKAEWILTCPNKIWSTVIWWSSWWDYGNTALLHFICFSQHVFCSCSKMIKIMSLLVSLAFTKLHSAPESSLLDCFYFSLISVKWCLLLIKAIDLLQRLKNPDLTQTHLAKCTDLNKMHRQSVGGGREGAQTQVAQPEMQSQAMLSQGGFGKVAPTTFRCTEQS